MISSDGLRIGVNDAFVHVGDYRLLEPLGHGGMGAVHLATRRRAGRDELVVLKLLREHIAQDDKYRQMFRREGAIATRLLHPNVVRTLEVGEHAGTHFLAMEFLDGQPFNLLIRRLEPALPLNMRLTILCEMLKGLHYVHELRELDGTPLQLVHRDVSPSNVFVTYEGDVRLLDFGVAKLGTALETSAGEFRGRLGYAAPERLWGRPADRRSDVFAAGVMMWETIAGRPLAARIAPSFFEARLHGREPSLTDVMPDVSLELAAICERALQVEPERRYQTAELFCAALTSYLQQHNGLWERSAMGQELQQRFGDARRQMHDRIHNSLQKRDHSLNSLPCASPIALAAVERSAPRTRPEPAARLQTVASTASDPTVCLSNVPSNLLDYRASQAVPTSASASSIRAIELVSGDSGSEPTRHSRIVPRRRGFKGPLSCLTACFVVATLHFVGAARRVDDVRLHPKRGASTTSQQTNSTAEHATTPRTEHVELPWSTATVGVVAPSSQLLGYCDGAAHGNALDAQSGPPVGPYPSLGRIPEPFWFWNEMAPCEARDDEGRSAAAARAEKRKRRSHHRRSHRAR